MARKSEKKPAQRGKTAADTAGASANPSSARTRARTPQQLERQERVFNASVLEGKTVRQIAAEFNIAQETVISDLRHEQARRYDEIADRREIEKARSVSFYQSVISRALRRAEISDEILEQIRDGVDCEKKVSDRSFDSAIKARERIDKLLGLDAPTKVDLGLQQLLDAID